MITSVIVLTSLLLAGLYFLCWLCNRDFRRRIEQPKYTFQQHLDSFEGRQPRPLSEEESIHDRQ